MQKPTMTEDSAIQQAGETIGIYLEQAIDEIDKRFGDGYAKKNPAFVSELVRCQTLDFNNASLVAGLYEIADALKEGK